MPLVICRACKSYAGKAIDYVTDKKKAERVITHGLDENRSLAQQFIDTAMLHGKGDTYDERKYYHIKISFEPKDRIENGGKLNAELAEKIANEYFEKQYGKHEYIIAMHTDKEHIHCHAIINAVNFESGKKIQHSNKDLSDMKDKVNDVAEKYGVSRFDWKEAVRLKREKAKQERADKPKELTQAEKYIQERHGNEWSSASWKETLRKKIDEAKKVCTTRAEFQKYLFENYGVEMPRNTNKTVSFKHPAVDETVRGVKLGAEYTAESIDEALKENMPLRGENERKMNHAELHPIEKRITDYVANETGSRFGEKIADGYFQKQDESHKYTFDAYGKKENVPSDREKLPYMKDKITDVAEKYEEDGDRKQGIGIKREELKQEIATAPKELTQAGKYIQERHGNEWSSSSWKEMLKSKIDEAKKVCTTRAEFQKYLFENYGIEMPRNTNDTVSFKHPAVDETVRGVKLGAGYTAESIDEALKENIPLQWENERKMNNAELRPTKERTTDNADAINAGDNTGANNEINIGHNISANGTVGSGVDENGERGAKTSVSELREKLQQIRGLGKRYNPAEQRRAAEAAEQSARKIREKVERVRAEQQASERESREKTERAKVEQRYVKRESRDHDDGLDR